MNKKIFIGSLITVAVLVFMSFTTVGGFQRIRSTSIIYSPLFNIRAKRAINEEIKEYDFNYVGIGKKSIIQFPKKMESIRHLSKVINILVYLNDKEFSHLISSLSNYLFQERTFNEYRIEEVTTILYKLRNNNAEVDNIFTEEKGNHISRSSVTCFPTAGCLGYWCLFFYILRYLMELPFMLFYVFITYFGVESICVSTCISHF
jgi:hypothetical protein